MNILQVGTYDRGGGAAEVSWNLFQKYRERGHHSYLAVGCRKSSDPAVFELPIDEGRGLWSSLCLGMSRRLAEASFWGATRISQRLLQASRWDRAWDAWRGRESFRYPSSGQLLEKIPARPDLVHLHNLHGDFFDLRSLTRLSHRLPVFWTLHDQWAFTGHCAYSLDCERWKLGCGKCPALGLYPALRRDGTAGNWKRKSAIYRRSELHVATPSQWLFEKLLKSNLGRYCVDARVIPNGVDLKRFHPATAAEKKALREKLGLPENAFLLLFVGNAASQSPFKDFATARAAAEKLAAATDREICLVLVGEKKQHEEEKDALVRPLPYETDADQVASYFRAADVYLHAAKADTFPSVVLEALASGLPVVATAVGGIPEQVRPYGHAAATGFLGPAGEAEALASGLGMLCQDPALLTRLGENARADAEIRFDVEDQVQRYLSWYQEILDRIEIRP